ncbi:Calx-beta domain-containing protein [Krasilnikovia sp. MM14-A1259]|uniref:Calx-beta domain-containing protein n=1 Tax=Krasilnikovia sp. MM14-A1259 TaxID=3373539 RepID=UPI0037FA745E
MLTNRRSVFAGLATIITAGLAGSTLAATPALAGPANDNFAFAQFLPGTNDAVGGRNDNGATAEPGEPAHAGTPAHASLWYRWTAPATGKAIFRTINGNTSLDTVLSVYTGSSLSALTPVAENDDAQGTRQSQVVFKATKGIEYKIAVDGFGSNTGSFKLTWTGNDDLAAAQTLPGPTGSFLAVGADIDGASAEPGEPAHAGQAAAHSIWYRWVAPANGIAEFAAVQGGFDSRIAAYAGTGFGALRLVAQNNDQQPGNTRARIVFAAKAGTEYRVAVDGANGAQGFDVIRYSLTDPKVSVGTATVVEGNSGTKTVTVPVSLNTDAPFPVSVSFATRNGTAVAPGDYVTTSGTLTFPPGFRFLSVPVQVVGDTVREPNEAFTVTLSNPGGGFSLGTAAGTVTITNND